MRTNIMRISPLFLLCIVISCISKELVQDSIHCRKIHRINTVYSGVIVAGQKPTTESSSITDFAYQEDTTDQCATWHSKSLSFKRMRNGAIPITLIGIPLATAGYCGLAQIWGTPVFTDDGNDPFALLFYAISGFAAAGGTVFTIGGPAMFIIGKKKYLEYYKKTSNCPKLSIQSTGNSFSLKYNF